MDYEDSELIICDLDEIIETSKHYQANLVIRLCSNDCSFSVIKNKWGPDNIKLPLELLDLFLEEPDRAWNSVAKML